MFLCISHIILLHYKASSHKYHQTFARYIYMSVQIKVESSAGANCQTNCTI